MPEPWQDAGFGLYVHWPFCQAKCPYCDFNSHVAASIDQDRWGRAYLSEIARLAAEAPGRTLRSIFFGGGTPSLMAPELVAGVIEAARAAWPAANDQEITLEANPTSVEAGRFQAYRAAGVNRVSLGLQSLNDGDLRRLGRLHDVTEGLRALELAKATFDRVSFDLIYARQDQSLADWQTELSRALEIAPDHLSLYQLTIEPGNAFGDRHARGRLPGLPDDDLGADLYLATQDLCATAGFEAYEISNHAVTGQESRHNLIYWRGGDYAGIGPGAHGRLTLGGTRIATDTPLAPGDWLQAVEMRGCGEAPRVALSPSDQAAEYLMMGLRLREGIEFKRLFSLTAPETMEAAIARMEVLGMLQRSDDRLALTERGRPLLNAVLREVMPG